MKQSFECTNFDCKHKTKEYKKVKIKDLYKEVEKEGVQVEENDDKTSIRCPKCGYEMIYVSIG